MNRKPGTRKRKRVKTLDTPDYLSKNVFRVTIEISSYVCNIDLPVP